jgi:Co/Zn/Cd efflux system component
LAIITDAAHMMSDLASLLTSILAIKIAACPATKSHTFGFYRAGINLAFDLCVIAI